MSLTVLEPGAQATLQDLGRPGHSDVGVPAGGAADRPALRLANRLVGNDDGAAGIEVLLGGLSVRAERTLTVAVTGAPVALTCAGRGARLGAPQVLGAGDVLTLGAPLAGLRSYLAVRGGIVAERLYGSASTDPVSGLGPAPLAAGQRLDVGTTYTAAVPATDVSDPGRWGERVVTARLVLGPRDDWFTPESVVTLLRTIWEATSDLDRVGVRLSGPNLARSRSEELPSEAVVRGAVQVSAEGRPIVFLADHPTTGGYPVIGVVVDDHTDRIAQLTPGSRLRFECVAAHWQ